MSRPQPSESSSTPSELSDIRGQIAELKDKMPDAAEIKANIQKALHMALSTFGLSLMEQLKKVLADIQGASRPSDAILDLHASISEGMEALAQVVVQEIREPGSSSFSVASKKGETPADAPSAAAADAPASSKGKGKVSSEDLPPPVLPKRSDDEPLDHEMIKVIIDELRNSGVSIKEISRRSPQELVEMHNRISGSLQQVQAAEPAQQRENPRSLPRVPISVPEISKQQFRVEAWTTMPPRSGSSSSGSRRPSFLVYIRFGDDRLEKLSYNDIHDLLHRAPIKILKELRKVKCINGETKTAEGCEEFDSAVDTFVYAKSLEAAPQPSKKRRTR